MIALETALSAIADFLNEAQNLGIVKVHSLEYSDVDKNEFLSEGNQLLSKFIHTIAGESISTSSENSEVLKNPVGNELALKSAADNVDETPEKKNLVQIQVDESEIRRRISAFISRKRKEVDEWNVQEFCSRPYLEDQNPVWEQIDSCARVDTVFVPRFGCKSHVKVSRVENRWGPQTHLMPEAKKIKLEPNTEPENLTNESLQAIEERLQNMESHLKLTSENSLRLSIFQRLKNLEDRILYLEGISPDYFHLHGRDYLSPKKKSHSEKGKPYSNWSFDDLQKRCQTLKEHLKAKPHQIKSELLE